MSEAVVVEVVPYPGPDVFGAGKVNDYVLLVGSALVLRSKKYRDLYKEGPSRTWSATDQAAVKAFQEDQGWKGTDADGIPGKQTWQRLGLG
ncbi:peptidoglycan-binding protein [Jiangella sp. DSM 45060]|uniref:peptidoglycan-binding protein n=1 Tax=Jiangella sp. DSM 45060 TaxID=1798224 RepID=UPI0012FE75CB|nr:peptidoglycan-binding protein [Jiangella sp. DSM 45060]